MTDDPTPETLERIGQMLFGGEWKKPLAAKLEVNERSLRRWAKGESPIPATVWRELRGLLAAEVRLLAKELPR